MAALPACVCVCHCLGFNFWSSWQRNFIFQFWQSFGPTDTMTYRYTQTHTDTHLNHTLKHYLYTYASKQVKKGNFLPFGIVMVFQIADLMFGWLVRQSKYIWGICLDGGTSLAFYTRLCSKGLDCPSNRYSLQWHAFTHKSDLKPIDSNQYLKL